MSRLVRLYQVALVPPMAPHGLRNTGDEPLRILGTFSASTVVSTFTRPFMTEGPDVVVIGSPVFMGAHIEEPAVA